MYKDKDQERQYQREYGKEWRKNNKEKLKGYRNEEDAEKRRERRLRYEKNNAEKVRATKKTWWGNTCRMYYTAKGRATKNNIPFTITREYVESITPAICPVLGIALQRGAENRDNSPSLDRIIPSLGYVEGNVVVVSNRANRLKGDASLQEMKQMVIFYEALISSS